MMIALALGLPSGLALLIGLPLGICLPYKLVGVMARRRGAKFLGQFPDAIDLIVRGVKSGLPISEAVAAVGREIGDPLGQTFRAVAGEAQMGHALEPARWSVAGRLDPGGFSLFYRQSGWSGQSVAFSVVLGGLCVVKK